MNTVMVMFTATLVSQITIYHDKLLKTSEHEIWVLIACVSNKDSN